MKPTFTLSNDKENKKINYGVNPETGKNILIDRKEMPCPHMLLTGLPGTGKTYAALKEVERVIKETTDDIIFLSSGDIKCPEGMTPMILSKDCTINPVDMVISFEDYKVDLILVSEVVLDIISTIFNRKLNIEESNMLNGAIFDVFYPFYERLVKNKMTHDFKNNPTINDILEMIYFPKEPDKRLGHSRKTEKNFVKELQLATEIYKERFSQKTNLRDDIPIFISRDNRLIRDKFIDDYAVLAYLFNRERCNCNKRNSSYTWIYIDDADYYFRKDYLRNQLGTLLKCSRKCGGIITLTTQGVDSRDRMFLNNIALCQVFNSGHKTEDNIYAYLDQIHGFNSDKIKLLSVGESVITDFKDVVKCKTE